MYLPQKNNWIYSSVISLISTVLVFIVFGLLTLTKVVAVWTDATVLYTHKSNPNIKIVTRYLNEGAFGGGTESGHYQIVLKRPLTPFLKMETLIDTNSINKNDWVKKPYDKFNTIFEQP